MTYDKLIYGKNDKERIIGIEPDDSFCTLFIQNEDGSISEEIVDNRYWILSHKKIDSSWVTLKGNLYYKYGKQYKERDAYLKARHNLRNEPIYGIYDAKESFMVNFGYTYFKGMKHNEVSVLAFDIEATGLEHDSSSKVLIISNTYRNNGKLERKMFTYDEFEDQGKMIDAWCDWVRQVNPAIIMGHNIYTYDLPYLNYIAKKNHTELRLGRNDSGIIFGKKESKFRKDGSQFLHYFKPYIYGRELLDSFFLSIRYDIGRKYESYGLKSIIAQEGLEVKDRQHYDASKIRFTYKDPTEWKKIKAYAEFDADDVISLWDLMGPSYFYMTQSIPKSFQAVLESASGAQINAILCRSYLQEGHSLPRADEIKDFQGGISFGIPGIYRNCWKLDIKSCYPSAILVNNLYSKNKDPEANMYKLCKYFTNQRFEYKQKFKETKDQYYQSMDAAAKVFINSIFGFCSASGLNFNDPEVAAKITAYGREYLGNGMKWATGFDKEYWTGLNNE